MTARILVGDALATLRTMEAGHWPYVPHLSVWWNTFSPKDFETWMALDAAWLEACDVVVRLPGYSPGADREEVMAGDLGIPVYTLEAWLAAVKALEASHGST